MFDHNAEAATVVGDRLRCIVQGGYRWTYAEKNRFTGKWEPEPKLLDEAKMAVISVLPELQQIRHEIKKLNKRMDDIWPEVMKAVSYGKKSK